jgi:hypothetical protein
VGTAGADAVVAAGCDGQFVLASGRECKVITGIDDHSRYCVIAGSIMVAKQKSTSA